MHDRSAVAGVILAAGRGRRYRSSRSVENSNKLLADLGGEPLIRKVARAALTSRLGRIVAVIGIHDERLQEVLGDLDVEILANPGSDEGQSTSVRVAVDALLRAAHPAVAGALFLPADQPLVSTALLDRLIETHRIRGGIVATAWNGESRAPVLFDRLYFAELAALRGDVGGRRLLSRHPEDLHLVEAESEAEVLDVDTVSDLQRLRRLMQ